MTIFYMRILMSTRGGIYHWRFIPFMINASVYTSITGTPVTLDDLSPWSNSVCTHTWYPFFKEPPLKVIQDSKNRATNKVLASVK